MSVFRTPASFLLCCLTEIHLSESLMISRWWPNSMNMPYLFWHFCGIWIPVFGKPTLSFKCCFIYCHPTSHSHTGAWVLLLLGLRLQLSLGSIPGNEAPSAVYPSQNGGRWSGEGTIYQSFLTFLVLHSLPSSNSLNVDWYCMRCHPQSPFSATRSLSSQSAQLLTPALQW